MNKNIIILILIYIYIYYELDDDDDGSGSGNDNNDDDNDDSEAVELLLFRSSLRALIRTVDSQYEERISPHNQTQIAIPITNQNDEELQ